MRHMRPNLSDSDYVTHQSVSHRPEHSHTHRDIPMSSLCTSVDFAMRAGPRSIFYIYSFVDRPFSFCQAAMIPAAGALPLTRFVQQPMTYVTEKYTRRGERGARGNQGINRFVCPQKCTKKHHQPLFSFSCLCVWLWHQRLWSNNGKSQSQKSSQFSTDEVFIISPGPPHFLNFFPPPDLSTLKLFSLLVHWAVSLFSRTPASSCPTSSLLLPFLEVVVKFVYQGDCCASAGGH